ncbi:hypothetical protein [Tsukamurella sp. 1534]|uniref:hypothetical protein n=1 Tax=Tsukamurella sp. 1534 TaxID=1151061 RepID=UPI0002FE369A|nr:hypothetical protein [Tsukamurella sp. 1534]
MATAPLVDDAPSADGSPAGPLAGPLAEAPARPTDSQRLASGLAQSFLGPLNVTRALTGLGASAAGKLFTALIALVRSAIAGPQVPDDATPVTLGDGDAAAPNRRRPLLIALAVVAVLALGGVAFKLLRTPSDPPVAPEPPRLRPATGATGDSAPASLEEVEGAEEVDVVPAEDDPRKRGE